MRTTHSDRNVNRKLSRALYSALPLMALVLPNAAHAATTSNTASLILPAGVSDPDTSNNTATDSDNILAALVATNDTVTGISAATGGTGVVNAFTGDTVNGVAASSSNATLAVASGSSVPTGLTFNTSTGAVDVTAGTAPGTYTFNYTLCEAANTSNCKTATISVTVDAVISPVTESGSGTSGTSSTVIADVRANDSVNGAPAASTNSTISTDPSNPLPTGFALDTTTGAITIAATVPPGSYDVWYQLCDKSSPTPNCATVKDTVTVSASILPATDSGSGTSGTASTVIADVRANDTVNGAAATTSNSTISTDPSNPLPSGFTLDTTTGAIKIDTTVAPGSYDVWYQLCDKSSPTANCATVKDTVTVAASITPVTENGSGLAFTASTVIVDVRANDTVNGAAATTSNSTISTDPSNPLPSGFTLDTTTGEVKIDATVAAGSYDVWYQLCDKSSPTANCATVKDVVTVSNRQADLVLTKSNGVTEVTSGQTTTYTLTVTNNGPDSVTGVVVKDAPGAGLTCPTTNPLSFGGTGGIPSGSFTVSDLVGSGVTLGTLANGQSVTVTYDCTVN